ncbi:MAG: hypothetical protein GY808_16110 [Gammaproteobacteria bacterium]|nr:hypothetical protein [Gammaproteobacteria bacterium]
MKMIHHGRFTSLISVARFLTPIAFADETFERSFTMSGIIKSVFLLFSLFSLVFISTCSLTADIIDESSKTRQVQSTNTEQIKLKSSEANNSLSVIKKQRKSRYVDISDPGLFLDKMASQKISGTVDSHKKLRAPDLSAQLKSSSFYFHLIDVDMQSDLDYDGYHSKFSINFDVDTNYNSATVYALFYIRYEGGPWKLYYESDYFDIYGHSSTDNVSVTTLLTNSHPPGNYDILIDLYDEYDNSLVATISPDDTNALANLYLEDRSYEANYGSYMQFSISDASITLLNDNDNDGFYHYFSLQFDADVSYGKALIYAKIWVRSNRGDWILDHTTSDFLLSGNSILDTHTMEIVWENGYNTGYYDIRVELYDATTFDLLATSVELDNKLFAIPLEGTSYDGQLSGSNSGIRSSSSSYISSGSMELALLGLLLLLGLKRYEWSKVA